MNIGEVWAALRIDGSKAKADATKAGTDAGDAASTAMGARIKTGAKVIGAALGAGLTVALTGRLVDLERATANFRKETGATADEAKRASAAINDMAGRNLQSVEAIGATLTKVHVDLGLTGDEAERVTETFLKFSQATGQDASEAVQSFDDILDSWGLTAADATGLMDKLIVSHQKYGGTLEDNQTTLAALAPAMKAANFQIDDGIALLGLFGSKGLDANTASAAFAKALTKVKSPEQLKAMIDDISSTQDGFARATKAGDLFGARAGAKLGNALAGAHLDDYKVSLDEAKGATDKAADASLTFGDRIKQAFSGIVSTATEVLGPAGPLLTAVGGISPLLIPAFAGLGKTLGKAMGTAMAPALASTLGAEIGGEITAGALSTAALAAAGLVIAIPATIVLGTFLSNPKNKPNVGIGGGGGIPVPLAPFVDEATKKKSQDELNAIINDWVSNLTDPKSIYTQFQKVLAERGAEGAKAYLDSLGTGVYDGYAAAVARGLALPHANDAEMQANGAQAGNMYLAGLGDVVTAPTSGLMAKISQGIASVLGNGAKDAVTGLTTAVVSEGLALKTAARQAWSDAMDAAQEVVDRAQKSLTAAFSLAPVNMKDAIKNGKAAIIEQFRDLNWQISHPQKEKEYGEWLQGKFDDAMAKAKQASKDGRPGLEAEWKGVAENIKAEMDKLPSHAARIQRQIISSLSSITLSIATTINAVSQAGERIASVFGPAPVIPHAATGGYRSGLTWTGERGPELVELPRGSYVHPHAESMAMASGSHSTVEVVVRDPDGGLARAGVGVADLGRWVTDELRRASDSAHIGSLLPQGL